MEGLGIQPYMFEPVSDEDADFVEQPVVVRLHIDPSECVLLGAKSDPNLNVDDPVCDHFFNDVWNKIAQTNAIIYEKVFRCLPLDSIRNLRELQEHVNAQNLSHTDLEKAKEKIQAIRGILVHFPLHFLCEEYLLPPLKSKEGMVPVEVWT